MNTLEGIATALYKRSNGQHVLSVTAVASVDQQNIWVDRSVKIPFDPNGRTAEIQGAISTVLDMIRQRREQVVQIHRNQDKKVALPVVVGFAADAENTREHYAPLLRDAFPALLSEFDASTSVHQLLVHILEEGSRRQSKTQMPAFHNYEFSPRDPKNLPNDTIPESLLQCGREIESFIRLAKAGNTYAWNELKRFTKAQAKAEVVFLKKHSTLDGTRYYRTGMTTQPYKDCAFFTYLDTKINGEYLKDIFTREVIHHMKDKHHFSTQTSNDPHAPAFSDITATFLADAWRDIHLHRTGKRQQFKNVFARVD